MPPRCGPSGCERCPGRVRSGKSGWWLPALGSAHGITTGSAVAGAHRRSGGCGRERELVRLVARGRTNAQIAAELHISVRTVGSHLDRIRDKTGCRRRADLTRLALAAGLV